MGKLNKAARSLQQLDDEIEALKEKARQLEVRLDESWDYFQEHSGELFVQSLIPRSFERLLPRTGIKLVDSILDNERVQKLIMLVVELAADWLGDGLNWLSHKIFSKKEE